MSIQWVSTGEMIRGYLSGSGFNVTTLVKESGLSMKTISLLLNDKIKMPLEVAEAMHRLIPEISEEFLVVYDAKYQLQKAKFEKEMEVEDLDGLIDFYQLRKLYPSIKSKSELFKLGEEIFGDCFKSYSFDFALEPIRSYAFSKASNPVEKAGLAWVSAAYYDYLQENELKTFNKKVFDEYYSQILEICNSMTYEGMMDTIKVFCEETGINFYWRKSIPNARIKGISFVDENNHYFIILSDLFKCVENTWYTFIHECMHISNGDITKEIEYQLNKKEKVEENERFIDDNVLELVMGKQLKNQISKKQPTFNNVEQMNEIYQQRKNAPINMIAEGIRYLTNTYNNGFLNSYIHYYSN